MKVKSMKPNAITLHASVPCPMKVPFKQVFSLFAASYQVEHPDCPLHCPDVTDCSSPDFELILQTARSEKTLPDIILTQNYEPLFYTPFAKRFLQTGLFEGVTNQSDLKAMPKKIRDNLTKNHIGVLCFGSRSIVQDLTVKGVPDNLGSWKELLSPEWEGQFTVHGHLDHLTFGMAAFLYEKFGDEGIIRYAKSITDIKHFSHIIKRLNSNDPYKTALNFLPDAAVTKIPSTKKIKILELKEGKILSPIVLFVKTSKREACREILEFFESKPFRRILADGCLLPDQLESGKRYFLPDFSVMYSDFKRLNKRFDKLYMQNLNFEKINERALLGSVCK